MQNYGAAAEVNLAQILSQGVFEPNSPLPPSQGGFQFILRPPGVVVFGELVMVFEELGVIEERSKFLTIWILNLKIICEYLKLGGV